MNAGVAIAQNAARESLPFESPGWTVVTPFSSAVTPLGPKTKILIKWEQAEIEPANWLGYHIDSRAFETVFLEILGRFLEGIAAASRSREVTPQLDIEASHVLRIPVPQTQWLSATVVNLGPAKPRLVLDVIPDEE